MKIIGILMCLFILTGCNNGGKELENRDFVMALGIEEDDGNNILYTSVVKLSNKGEDTGKEEVMYKGEGKDIAAALEEINRKTAGNIYFGHTKALVIGSTFSDYGKLIDYISGNVELGRDVVVVKADEPERVLETNTNDKTAANYIYQYFEDKKKVDIDRLTDSYNHNEKIIIPAVYIGENGIFVKEA